MAALTEAELQAASLAAVKKYMFSNEPVDDDDYDAAKVVARRRYENFLSVSANPFIQRTTPVSLFVASGAASLLDPWRDPPARILGGNDE